MMQKRKRVARWKIVAFGIILAFLASVPIAAMVAAFSGGTYKYALMREVPERGDGAYLQVNDGTRAGVIQLYPWFFRRSDFPADAPVFHPAHVTALIISQRGTDDPANYNLFHLDDGSQVEFDVRTRPTKIFFTPRTPLAPGAYLLDIPKSGMFADRQYYYFRLDMYAQELPVQ